MRGELFGKSAIREHEGESRRQHNAARLSRLALCNKCAIAPQQFRIASAFRAVCQSTP
jgi:hypothetical protein